MIAIASLCLGIAGCGGGGGDSKDNSAERYQIRVVATKGGNILLNNTSVEKGYTATASVTADDHYDVASVAGCGGKLFDGTYQTGSILSDCTITATFTPEVYRVTVASSVGGTSNIYSSDIVYNDLAKFIFTEDPGYHIVSVNSDCGGSLALKSFTSGPISANCTVTPVFALDSATDQTETYLVTVMSSVGGTPLPGSLTVTKNDYAKFDLLADNGYHIDSVTSSCGGSLVLIRFTTGKVNEDCSIQPHFVLDSLIDIKPSTDPTEIAEISGTAARGAAIKGELVTARCADGKGFKGNVITDAKGNFSGQVLVTSLPCALRVNDGSTTYYSLVTEAGTANITPLTSLILAYTSATSGYEWYYSGTWQTVIYNLPAAQSSFSAAMTSAGYSLPPGDFLPFKTKFVVGDAWDGLLDQVHAAIQASGTSYDAVLDELKTTGDLSKLPVRH
ncbi:MAG: hypothetical protein EOP49_33690 [Sphingobacteriales bacterium]|nr:MAG: hypothetical protein EOP49_33690 [Sphingobacteriales bacterium]